ncbi:MAG: hypothetical protein ABIL09_16340 [Gemmatimonadota bacterium]
MALIGVTHRGRRLWRVPSPPPDEEWVYQLAIPFQLSPTELGLAVNVRRGSVRTVDLEVGSDLVILDRLEPDGGERAAPLNRAHLGPHPRTGRSVLFARYPVVGGFVPVGARRADGSPHPHAGTGFGLSQVIAFPTDRTVGGHWELPEEEQYHALEVQQYRYDGARFEVVTAEMVPVDDWLPGWRRAAPGLCAAIPDGGDLLQAVSAARGDGPGGTGVLRWQRRGTAWQPDGYTPVTPADISYEPTLVRDRDGALLFTARGGGPEQDAIRLWRSTDGGHAWERILHLPGRRSETPVSLNCAADGSLYVAGSPAREVDSRGRALSSVEMREMLLLWPLADDRHGLQEPLVARDCLAEFGPAAAGSIWRADHPVGLTARLADGQWHHVLCYRVLDREECVGDRAVTPRTGTYVEEVFSDGAAAEMWRF